MLSVSPKASGVLSALIAVAVATSSATAGAPDAALVHQQGLVAPMRATTFYDQSLKCLDLALSHDAYGNGINLVATSLIRSWAALWNPVSGIRIPAAGSRAPTSCAR